MASPSASRIALKHLEGGLVGMDYYARARIIEAAAKMPEGSFSDNVSASGFLSEGPIQFPDAHPDWFSTRDQGLYDAVIGGANEILQSEAGEATAEEIAQNMAAGLSIGGGARSDVYGDLGKKYGRVILSGQKKPRDLKSTLWGWASNRALDVWRKSQRHKKEREKAYPSMVRIDEQGGVPAQQVIDRTPNEVMLSLISDPQAGRKFYKWVYDTIKRKATPVQQIIVELSLDHLARHKEWPSANKIRDKVIEMKGSGISVRKINDHRKKVEQLIADEMEKSPQVLDWVERYLDLAALGYGGGQLRLAKRVADRFLRRHQTTSV
jgi:hypothetical protein